MWDLSPLIKDQTCVPCIGRWTLNHWTREVPIPVFKPSAICSNKILYKSQCKTDYQKKKKKKIGKQSCFFWKEAGWESGDPGPPSSSCESSQDSSEHTYFSGRHSPAPRLLLTPLRANGPRDIAKFTHLDGRPLGRSEFLASVPRFSLPHSSTLLNWYLSFFRRKHTRIQRFLKSVVFFCFNTTNSELLRTLPLSQMFSSCVLGGGLQVELGLQVTGAWQSVVHNDLKIRFHWS